MSVLAASAKAKIGMMVISLYSRQSIDSLDSLAPTPTMAQLILLQQTFLQMSTRKMKSWLLVALLQYSYFAGVFVQGAAPWVSRYGPPSATTVGNAIYVDDIDSFLYIGGHTDGSMYSTHSGRFYGLQEAFIAKISAVMGGAELWGTQVQGSDSTSGESVKSVTSYEDMVYAVGTTGGSLYSTSNGGLDVFLMALRASNGSMVWGVQLGSTREDTPLAVTADSTGIYITGTGYFYAAPSSNNYYFSDVFVMKVDLEGNLEWGEQMGSGGTDSVQSVAIVHEGVVEISGYSSLLFTDYVESNVYTNGFQARYNTDNGEFLGGNRVYIEYSDHSKPTAKGNFASYQLSSGSVVQVTSNPCGAGLFLDTTGYFGAACRTCPPGRVSSQFSFRCTYCDWGYAPRVDHTKCEQCPAGFHSHGVVCSRCHGLLWSEAGDDSCELYNFKIATTSASIAALAAVASLCVLAMTMLTFALHLAPGMRAVVLMSTITVLSDHVYVMTAVFDRRIYLVLCLVFLLLPLIHFLYFALRLCDPSQHLSLRLLRPHPTLWTHMWRVTVSNGLPLWDDQSAFVVTYMDTNSEVVSGRTLTSVAVDDNIKKEDSVGGGTDMENVGGEDDVDRHGDGENAPDPHFMRGAAVLAAAWTETVLKQLLFSLLWCAGHLIYFAPWYLLHMVFYNATFIVGFYLFQFQLLHVKKVQVLWMQTLMGKDSFSQIWEVAAGSDCDYAVREVNTTTLSEVSLQAIPQFVLQLLNSMALSGRITLIAFVSITSSGSFILYQIFRSMYWHVWKRFHPLDMPILWLFSSDEEVVDALKRHDIDTAERLRRKSSKNSDGSGTSGDLESENESENSPLILHYEERALEMTAMIDTQKEVNRKLVMEQDAMRDKLVALESLLLADQPTSTETETETEGPKSETEEPKTETKESKAETEEPTPETETID